MALNTSEFVLSGKTLLLAEALRGKKNHLALSGDDGRVIWEQETVKLADPGARSSGEQNLDISYVTSTAAPAVSDDLVVFGAYSRHLYGRSLATGQVRWRYVPPANQLFNPGGFNTISVVDSRATFEWAGFLHSVDVTDRQRGSLHSRYCFWADFSQTPARCAVGHGRIFSSGYLHQWLVCFDGRTLDVLWKKPARFYGFPALAGNLAWVSCQRDIYLKTPAGLRAYDLDGRLVWFLPGVFSEPAIASGRVFLIASDTLLCLEPDPNGPAFRNLALERVGEKRERSQVVLRVTNTGFAVERKAQVVADVSQRKDDVPHATRLARHRFPMGTLKPGEHRDVTFALPGKDMAPGWLYVAAFIPKGGGPYRGDDHLAFIVD